jgi:hypothetical protein
MGLSRLLVTSCSAQKCPAPGVIPAISRYDGPVFRLLRKHLLSRPANDLHVQILSAEYGLIDAGFLLPLYDRRMTAERARALKGAIRERLTELFYERRYSEGYLMLGRRYTTAVDMFSELTNAPEKIITPSGGMGARLTHLKHWLQPLDNMNHGATTSGDGGHEHSMDPAEQITEVRLRGTTLRVSHCEILEAGRRAVACGDKHALSCHGWSVRIDDAHIAPKWLVSKVSCLPVSSFHTDDARRLLEQVGFALEPYRGDL